MGSSVLEHAIKVRKPYTITKQRERWTEEEHDKFLEALKLYGRSWRQIEEHIGTKNAVQIRSHAQKFFSKVVRESDSNSSGTAKTIEIPPPRPKKKPAHPYPRKLGHLSSKISVLEQSKWSSIPNSSISDQENRSPTSVLSAVGSDTFGSSASNLMNGCISPASSAAGSEPVGTLLSEQENGCQSATTSAVEEDKPPSLDTSFMEVDLGADDRIPSKEASSMEGQATSLKLFGRTVLVTDTQKLFSSSSGNVEQCHQSVPTVNIESHHGNIDIGQQIPVQTFWQNATHGDLSGEGRSQWNLWPGGIPQMFYCLPSHGNLTNPAEASIVPLPWSWAFYGGVPLPLMSPQSMSSEQDQLPSYRDSDDRGMHMEGSLTGSNSASDSEVGTGNRGSNAVDAEHSGDQGAAPAFKLRISETSAFRSLKASSNKPSRGFVPYRRCVAEKEVKHPQMANGNGDGHGIQLCL